MKTGAAGIFVMAWSQTRLDGLRDAPRDALRRGAEWSWTGEALRLDGPGAVLPLGDPLGAADARARAGAAVRALLRRVDAPSRAARPRMPDEAGDDPEGVFRVTDGRRVFPAALIEGRRGPLVVFAEGLPPRGAPLWVVDPPQRRRAALHGAEDRVICFARGTRIATPRGPVAIEVLRPGDRVLTHDDGPAEVLWAGHRAVTGARLLAMPALRPLRLRAGGLGDGLPEADLLVSPDHAMLMRGAEARALFGTPEVLVAAADLRDDDAVTGAGPLHSVVYHHILLPPHGIVWANGVASESFDPARLPAQAVPRDQAASLARALGGDAANYGPPARRVLDPFEAAILRAGPTGAGPGRRAFRAAR